MLMFFCTGVFRRCIFLPNPTPTLELVNKFSATKNLFTELLINLVVEVSNFNNLLWLNNTGFRSSHPGEFLREGFVKIYSKFTGGHPCQNAISIMLQSKFIEIAL